MIPDPRHLSNGWEIPSEGYADQPYVVQTDDGAWLCTMTTGSGEEGATGQHVVSRRSTDCGRSWEPPVALEPSDGPEASYSVLLKTPFGRIYCFYNHNTDNVREVKTETGGTFARVDSLGHYVFKYSDDGGRSWSAERYDVPMREFACDRANVYGGSLRFFWNVGKPVIRGTEAILCMHKVGAMGTGFFAQSEGVFLRSPNLLTESDPTQIVFETLPDGEIGLRTPAGGGRVAEEHSLSVMSDGSLYVVYRTIDGWPAHAYSRDGGHSWTPPAYLTYTPGGRRMKHPRAANFAWRCRNGQWLYWFHNHGGAAAFNSPGWDPYNDRNPAWVSAGREVQTPDGLKLEWSQPEILLYEDDPFIRMSYPDLIETADGTFITETQKAIGRVHQIDATLLDGLFAQWERAAVAQEGLLLEVAGTGAAHTVAFPGLPAFLTRDHHAPNYCSKDLRAGFSLEFWLTLPSLAPGQLILSTQTASGQGLFVGMTPHGTLGLIMSDGRQTSMWDSDPGMLSPGKRHHVVLTVDGGPKIITFTVDGALCDGGDDRQFGWGRFSPTLQSANGSSEALLGESVDTLRVYGRALRTSEAVGNWRAG
jgi:hypothetical protein